MCVLARVCSHNMQSSHTHAGTHISAHCMTVHQILKQWYALHKADFQHPWRQPQRDGHPTRSRTLKRRMHAATSMRVLPPPPAPPALVPAPLCPQGVDVARMWRALLAACDTPPPGTAAASAAASRRHSESGTGASGQVDDVDMGGEEASGKRAACPAWARSHAQPSTQGIVSLRARAQQGAARRGWAAHASALPPRPLAATPRWAVVPGASKGGSGLPTGHHACTRVCCVRAHVCVWVCGGVYAHLIP